MRLIIFTEVKILIAVEKHHDQKHLGEENVHFRLQLSGHTPSLRVVRVGAQGGNL